MGTDAWWAGPTYTHSTTMHSYRRAALLLGTLALCTLAQAGTDNDSRTDDLESFVHYQGKSFAPGDWPAGVAAGTRAEIMRWSPLARELGYRMDVVRGGRVMILSSRKFNRSVRREERLVKRGIAAFDALVAPPTDEGTEPAVAGRMVEECCVLLRMHDRSDYEAATEFLGRTRPYLGPWAACAASQDGFQLRQPNCAAWIEREAQGSANNQLVNNLASGLVAARYGEPPAWLQHGVALHVELKVCRSIRTLPDAEHRHGWSSLLKDTYGQREGLTLACEDFATQCAGDLQAGMAWGLVQFLSEHRPGSLGPILGDLGRYAARHGRVTHEDGRWEPRPGYEVPTTVQAQILQRHGQRDLMAECTGYFQKGSRYRSPAAK